MGTLKDKLTYMSQAADDIRTNTKKKNQYFESTNNNISSFANGISSIGANLPKSLTSQDIQQGKKAYDATTGQYVDGSALMINNATMPANTHKYTYCAKMGKVNSVYYTEDFVSNNNIGNNPDIIKISPNQIYAVYFSNNGNNTVGVTVKDIKTDTIIGAKVNLSGTLVANYNFNLIDFFWVEENVCLFIYNNYTSDTQFSATFIQTLTIYSSKIELSNTITLAAAHTHSDYSGSSKDYEYCIFPYSDGSNQVFGLAYIESTSAKDTLNITNLYRTATTAKSQIALAPSGKITFSPSTRVYLVPTGEEGVTYGSNAQLYTIITGNTPSIASNNFLSVIFDDDYIVDAYDGSKYYNKVKSIIGTLEDGNYLIAEKNCSWLNDGAHRPTNLQYFEGYRTISVYNIDKKRYGVNSTKATKINTIYQDEETMENLKRCHFENIKLLQKSLLIIDDILYQIYLDNGEYKLKKLTDLVKASYPLEDAFIESYGDCFQIL